MKKSFFLGFVLLGLAGCQATQVRPDAQKVRITTNEPTGCEYLGEVTGNQGNFFTGGWTSNENLETGARNDMKNKAVEMGGNTIHMLTNRAGQTGSVGRYGGSSQQTNVTYVGAVYKCGAVAAAAPAAAPATMPIVNTPKKK